MKYPVNPDISWEFYFINIFEVDFLFQQWYKHSVF